MCHLLGQSASKNSTNIGIIIGAAAGGCVLLLLLIFAGVYALRQKKIAQKANEQNPFGMTGFYLHLMFFSSWIVICIYIVQIHAAHWDQNKSSGNIPQLKGARCFSFEEINKYTNHFSEANNIGSGGYGKV